MCLFRYLICLFCLMLSFSAFANTLSTSPQSSADTVTQPIPNYKVYVNEIKQRLDAAAELYQNQHIDEAKQRVQMAYFEIFENLEGAIRINFSAKKSYQMEAMFGEIRKMMGNNAPVDNVLSQISQLKSDLTQVLPALETGHQITADSAHSVYSQSDIAPYWQASFKVIDDDLAAMLAAYQKGDFDKAKKLAQAAQYDGYKNSEMEMAVRENRSAKQSGAINHQFYNLIKLSEKAGNINELSYEITNLLQDIEALLPNLPSEQDEKAALAAQKAATEHASGNKDWSQVAEIVNQQLQDAIKLYNTGAHEKAMLAVQNTYFDVFESSGFENKIGSRDSDFKATLEGYFTRMVSFMKAGKSSEKLQEQAQGLADGMAQAVNMIQGTHKNDWSLFLYSLLIIAREGLEALLIVAAIVTYLVKNNHQDKLPVIRQSIYVALAASVVTAAVFQAVFSNAGASRELLEGFTMIFAVIMLFMMSYWLLSKVEANNWKRYLEGKLSMALTTGSLVGLWLTSFLAVYREGAETVLFYYALVGDVQSSMGYAYLLGGLVVGIIFLAVCYFVMRYTVVKLPLKPFFMFTGSFMYLMAFVFAGKSVLELIEGKLFQPTFLPHIIEIPWLGIYPYAETLAPQVVLVLAAIFALWYMKCQSRTLNLQ